ncbi:pheromone processing endoprotease [Lecanora helva]
MLFCKCLSLLALAYVSSAAGLHSRNHDTHDYYALHLQPQTSPQQVASALGLDYEGKLGELPDHHTFSSPRHRQHQADTILEDLRRRRRKRSLEGVGVLDGVLWSQKQKTKRRMEKRYVLPPLPIRGPPNVGNTEDPNPGEEQPGANQEAVAARDDLIRDLEIKDPIFGDQWHLFNTMQLGHDINVTGVWQQGITGEGATAVMVDDGIDMYSDDLKDNYFAKGSYDFNDNTDEPKPRLKDDRHGTRCAGEIAAVKNGVCGVGVAWNARIGGIRILSKVITDEDEAHAMNYEMQENQIYSCSWGPPDDGRSMDAPGILIRKAVVNAIQNGRQKKGNIYVFAAGNGRNAGDNCNFDGYTNSIYSITIGGIDRKGKQTYYSEHCSAQLAVTYSSGSGDAIHTTDVGVDKCYSNHGGTSAAAPLGAGIFALALSARPELTWRDLQNVLVLTSVPVNEDEDWDTTFIGRKFSHAYGYGKLDAYAVVEKAKSIELLKPQAWFNSPWMHVNHPIPQGVEGLLSSFEVTEDLLKKANLERLEHVTVTMNINHTRRGDLSVELRSPTNLVSHLSVARKFDDANEGYVDWTFMSVAHWGEPGTGKWSIVVKDTNVNEHNGTFTDWRLTLWGECIDPSTQDLLPMPTEHDDDDHDVVSAPPSSITVDPGPTQTGDLPANPTDHQHRPINAKPTTQKPDQASASSTASPSSSSTSLPDVPPEEDKSDTNFLPHYFPTFGVSKRTQIWIYGAVGIIILFCAVLGTYMFIQRRKRRRSEREEYEFEALEEDDMLNGGGRGGAGGRGKGRGRRAGELYDAFAGESDEEGLLSEDESVGDGDRGRYRDRDDGVEKEGEVR